MINEQAFLQKVMAQAKTSGINPLLLLSDIEGIYTFRDVPLNEINFSFLDSLILTIFTLRIGDGFHALAEENLKADNYELKLAAIQEITEMSPAEIEASGNTLLQSFYKMLDGKSPVRHLHINALEAAAVEINRLQLQWKSGHISEVILYICKEFLGEEMGRAGLFG